MSADLHFTPAFYDTSWHSLFLLCVIYWVLEPHAQLNPSGVFWGLQFPDSLSSVTYTLILFLPSTFRNKLIGRVKYSQYFIF